jgi:hypothetical protein
MLNLMPWTAIVHAAMRIRNLRPKKSQDTSHLVTLPRGETPTA